MKKIRLVFLKIVGPILFSLLAFIPIVFWLEMMPIKERFPNIITSFVSLGQIAGLFGLSLFAVSLILSARIKLYDNLFFGINRAYFWHRIYGSIAFMALLMHPLFLIARTLPISFFAAAKFLLPEGALGKDLGFYALSLMIILLVLTLFVSLKYEIWKSSHKFLGIAFFLGGLHSLLMYSDIAVNPWLRFYMIVLVILGLVAYFYRTILGYWLIKKYEYQLVEKKVHSENVTTLVLEATGEVMKYVAGQFIFIRFNRFSLFNEIHPFSISSAPGQEKCFQITVKNLGDYTSNINEIEIGTVAQAEGPYGKFSFEFSNNKKQIWIGGGVGITPFMAMLERMQKLNDKDYEIDLYYCTKNIHEQPLLHDLLEKTKTINNFNLFSHCSIDQGRVTVDYINKNSNDLKDRDIFLCGPAPMIKSLKRQFISLGLSRTRIYSEEFNLN